MASARPGRVEIENRLFRLRIFFVWLRALIWCRRGGYIILLLLWWCLTLDFC